MKNHTTIKNLTIATAAVTLLSVIPVFAETTGSATYVPPTSSTTRPLGGHGRVASSTIMMNREARQASTTANRIEKGQQRGDTMLDQRVTSLGALITRIQGMKYVSDSDKATIEGVLNSEISQLGNLKNQIGTDTSTSSLKTDVDSITKSYRVYALVQPQAQITAAADRVLNIVSTMNTVVSKINLRIASSTATSTSPTVQTSLSDISAKLTDASTQANAAIAQVSGLKPDNGDKTIAASNLSALKGARSKLNIAQKDLTTVRKDIESIVKSLHK